MLMILGSINALERLVVDLVLGREFLPDEVLSHEHPAWHVVNFGVGVDALRDELGFLLAYGLAKGIDHLVAVRDSHPSGSSDQPSVQRSAAAAPRS
jgi:hypothetical protein